MPFLLCFRPHVPSLFTVIRMFNDLGNRQDILRFAPLTLIAFAAQKQSASLRSPSGACMAIASVVQHKNAEQQDIYLLLYDSSPPGLESSELVGISLASHAFAERQIRKPCESAKR